MTTPKEDPRKRGRKSDVPGEPYSREGVTMTTMHKRKARVVGNGNFCLGVRRSIDLAYDRYQSTPDEPDKKD